MKNLHFLVLLLCSSATWAQSTSDRDALFIKDIYNHSLSQGECYDWLDTLSRVIGPRLSGTENNYRALDYTQGLLESMGADLVSRQECMVKRWERGEVAEVRIVEHNGNEVDIPLRSTSLGNTYGTGPEGMRAELIEVHSLDTLDILGEAHIKDKIVFFNRPMDPSQLSTFNAYGKAVDQRVAGANKAGKYGARAVLVRSMTTRLDDVPHSGVCSYKGDGNDVPAMAISTNDAEKLSQYIETGNTRVFMKNDSYPQSDTLSYNIIGEIKGTEFPNEIILVGGHIDSWDLGGGAHDDGSGCVHALQVFKTLIDIDYQPKRTLRCVMFNNEENGLGGGRAYAKQSNLKGEFHLAAIESDAGGFTPQGFTCTSTVETFPDYFKAFNTFSDLLGSYDLFIKKGGGGADIGPLITQGGLLIGFRPDSARYFDFHHTDKDVIENVNKRELTLGAAAITSLVYLIDQHGLNHGK